jgi:hypothetical protein
MDASPPRPREPAFALIYTQRTRSLREAPLASHDRARTLGVGLPPAAVHTAWRANLSRFPLPGIVYTERPSRCIPQPQRGMDRGASHRVGLPLLGRERLV